MSKKILSVMLALVMVLSVFSIVSFAAVNVYYETYDEEAGETEIAYTQKWSLETENVADANGKYTVDVVLETNYGVGPISFAVVAEGATLESAVEGAALIAADGFNADVRLNKTNNIVYIIPEPASEGSEAPVLAAGSVIATLTFALTADTATVAIMNDAKLADNAGNLIAARPDDGTLACNTIAYGQRVIDADGNDIALGDEIASVTLGAEQAADPVLSGVDGGYVDADNMYVYGVPAGDDAANYFTVENGTFEMVANAGGYTNGTGATLVVKDNNDNEFATYTLIIFGDVDGDGSITSTDCGTIKNASLGGAIDGGVAYEFAADVDGDGSITSTDCGTVKNASLGGEITCNPFLA